MKIRSMRSDDFLMFNYFTLIALILLFLFGYIIGVFGLGIATILLSILVYFGVAWGKGLGRSFANTSANTDQIEGEAMIIALICLGYSSYLALGLNSLIHFVKEDSVLGLYFYLWLASFCTPILSFYLLASYRKYSNNSIK